SNINKDVHPSYRQISQITKQVMNRNTDLTNLTKENNQSKSQKFSNTNKNVHPSDIQLKQECECI
ncbi:MAG: hypothetical protein ACK53Y_15490, partial [bacterium]